MPSNVIPLGLIDTRYWDIDLQAMIADLPSQARWDSTVFFLSISQLDISYALTLVGNTEQNVFSAVVPTTYVNNLAPFVPGTRIEIQFPVPGVYSKYQILIVTSTADGVAYNLTLASDHRNNG